MPGIFVLCYLLQFVVAVLSYEVDWIRTHTHTNTRTHSYTHTYTYIIAYMNLNNYCPKASHCKLHLFFHFEDHKLLHGTSIDSKTVTVSPLPSCTYVRSMGSDMHLKHSHHDTIEVHRILQPWLQWLPLNRLAMNYVTQCNKRWRTFCVVCSSHNRSDNSVNACGAVIGRSWEHFQVTITQQNF